MHHYGPGYRPAPDGHGSARNVYRVRPQRARRLMGAGLGLGLLTYALWRLARALAILTARLLLMALGVTVWLITGAIISAAWLLEHLPRRSAPADRPHGPQGYTLAELLAPYTRPERNAS